MNRMKKYFTLMLALLLCLTALWGCGKDEPQQPNEDKTPTDQTQTDDTQEPDALSDEIVCSNGSRTLRFQRNEKGTWSWKDDTDFPLDNSYVETLLTTIEEMLALQPITTDKTLKKLGLEEDDTDKYVTVSDEKGQSVTWYLGKTAENGSQYVRRADDETFAIYLAPADLSAQVNRSIYAMMVLPQLPTIDAEKITAITIQSGETIHELRSSTGDTWYDGAVNVTSKVKALLEPLAQPEVTACVDFKPSKGAPAICGLSKSSPVLTVEFADQFDTPTTFTLTVGNPRGEGYCVTINDDSTIYLMPAPLVDAVQAFVQ